MRILVADDDPVYRSLVAGLLQDWGLEAQLAHDGAEAWKILHRPDAPELVILDWDMPHIDGFEVCRRTRQAKGDGTPYILLMTGNRKREDLLRILLAGADDYLLKPFEPLDLKIRLRLAMRMLALQQQAGSVGGHAA